MRPALILLLTLVAIASSARAAPSDPLARAVVDSLASSSRSSPSDLLDAVVKTVKVDALDEAKAYLGRFLAAVEAAGERRPDVLADLGDTFDDGTLLATSRKLGAIDPRIGPLVRDIQTASRLRRRDPARLERAIADLASDSYATRTEAARRLAAAGAGALGPIVTWLSDPKVARGDDPATLRARSIARDLVRGLGDDGIEALVARLGGDDFDRWPGVITAIDGADPEPRRVARFLIAAALVDNAPAEARRRARALLERLVGRLPTKAQAIEWLAKDLDSLLCAEPVVDRADDGPPAPIDTFVWDSATRSVVRRPLVARARRSIEAVHLARDLEALGASDRPQVALILLARLEVAAIVAGERRDEASGRRFAAALTGPEGLSIEEAAAVLDDAMRRQMFDAAIAAAMVIADAPRSAGGGSEPAIRRGLVRGLDSPHLELRFASARALVLKGPRGLYAGKSRVVETLVRCATSRGDVRAVIAHPSRTIAQEIAAGVATLGYAPSVETRGRDAVVAARANCDVRLVVIARQLGPPGAHETAQFLSWIPSDGPLDVAFVTDSAADAPIEEVSEADLARAAARLERAGESLRLLAHLADGGEDVSESLPVALDAAAEPPLADAAIGLLSRLGRPDAQAALRAIVVRPSAADDLRERASVAFRESVGRYGILLDSGEMLAEYRRYNGSFDPAVRRWSGAILDTLEAPPTMARLPSGDASQPQ